MLGVLPSRAIVAWGIPESQAVLFIAGDEAREVGQHVIRALQVVGGAVPMRLWLPLGLEPVVQPATPPHELNTALAALTDLVLGAGERAMAPEYPVHLHCSTIRP